jgi:type II secretory pathway pseudopilin PulG
MSSNTKILVLKARELIYTLIFAVLGIALVLLLIYMFSSKTENGNSTEDSQLSTSEEATDSESTSMTEDNSAVSSNADGSASIIETDVETASAIITTTTYVPGTYAAPINLGGTILNLEVYIDDTCIPTASITNLDETTKDMYPLIEPSLADINNQLAQGCTPDEITYSHDNKYTSLVIIDAIRTALLE